MKEVDLYPAESQRDGTMTLTFRALFMRLALVFCAGISIVPAQAATVTLDVNPLTGSVAAGDTAAFSGTITNRSGVTLDSTDLFLGFGEFDFDALTPIQVLGNLPFSLGNFTFIANVDLFTVEVAAGTLAGIYDLQVFLFDVNGNVSDTNDLRLVVTNDVVTVPEPSTAALVGLALGLLTRSRRRFALPRNASAVL